MSSPPIDRSSCPAPRHGTALAYDANGCRCPDARDAYRIQRKRRREGRLPAGRVPHVGTTRRVQALAALGWPNDVLAAELGLHSSYVRDLRINRRGGGVYRTTAIKVAAMYERLSATPGPSARVRMHAVRRGWASPMAWDGLDMDDPTAQPYGRRTFESEPEPARDPVVELVERAEKLRAELEAAAPYSGQPFSWAAVAAQLGVKLKTLEKARQRVRKAAGQNEEAA